MSGEYVLDACVAAKILFEEVGSQAARNMVASADHLIAPELIMLEIGNVAVTKVRRNEITSSQARGALFDLAVLFDVLVSNEDLRLSAMEVALTTVTSPYDAIYAALAIREGLTIVTADKRFVASLRGMKDAPEFILLEGM